VIQQNDESGATQDLESAFEKEQHRRMPGAVRVACLLGIVAFVVFALADPLLVDDVAPLLVARLIIVVVITAVLGVSFLKAAQPHIELVAVLACLAIGGGVVAVTELTGGTASRYHEALLLTFFGFGLLIPWRTLLAGATFSILVLVYDVVLLVADDMKPVGTWVTNNLVLWLGVVIATVGVALASKLRKDEFENRWQLGAANEKLKALDRMKNEFFANVSHELRTPLTLILAPLEDLLSKWRGLPQADALDVMRRNAERLLQLIDDLLDLAKLDVGGLRLNICAIDVGMIAAKVVEVARPTASARAMTLSLQSVQPDGAIRTELRSLLPI
jgi:signal transduction histidine kinase